MDKIRATVIIPNYNGLKFMEPCMAALKGQTYTGFRVIIVDNGSSDGSVEYLRALAGRSMQGGRAGEDASSGCAGSGSGCAGPGYGDAGRGSGGSGKAGAGVDNSDRYSFPIDIIFLPENTGFSGAVNAGILASDTEFAVLLNNDTEADPDYLRRLLAPFDEPGGERTGAVSPRMVQLYNKGLLDDAGDGYNILGWAFQRGVGQSVDKARFMRRTSVFSACAGAAAYRRSALEEIALTDRDTGSDAGMARPKDGTEGSGVTDCIKEERRSYFDPMHFAYLEDLDVSFRLRIHGYNIIYEPSSVVYHVGSGTSGSRYNSFKVRLAARNNVYLNYKNMPLFMLLINLPGILAGALVKLIYFTGAGFGKDYLKGFAEGIKNIGACRAHKTFYRRGRLMRYIQLEIMLITDTFSYVQDFAVRQMAKLGKRKP